MNQVLLSGKLGPNIQLQAMDDGTPVASFAIATHRRGADRDGHPQLRTDWHLCVAFGEDATLAHSMYSRGGLLKVEGYLQSHLWTDKSGHDHWIAEVIVDRLSEDVPF